MNEIVKILIMGLSFLTAGFFSVAHADNLSLKSYYSANCNNFQGKWQGTFVDPSDLYGNGGPWPVTIIFQNHANQIQVSFDSSKAPSYVRKAVSGQMTAFCQNGILSQLSLSKSRNDNNGQGMFIAKHLIMLKIPAGSAMTGTEFVFLLTQP